MTNEPTLDDAIATVKRAYMPNDPWNADDFTEDNSPPEPGEMEHAIARIMNAVVSGELAPADDKDATIARLTDDKAGWKARYFKTRDERDKAQIASANYANFNHEWRQRAEQAEAKLAEVTAELRGLWGSNCTPLTDADRAFITAHLSYELEAEGKPPSCNQLAMEVVRNSVALKTARAEGFAQGIEAAKKVVRSCCPTWPPDGPPNMEAQIINDTLCDAFYAVDELLYPTPPVDDHKTQVHDHQAGLTLTDEHQAPQADPVGEAARVAELEEALGPFASAWRIAKATGLTSMGQLGPLARNEVGAISFMKAAAALAQKGE